MADKKLIKLGKAYYPVDEIENIERDAMGGRGPKIHVTFEDGRSMYFDDHIDIGDFLIKAK